MSKLILKKKYYWYIISDDGLLKDPPKFGSYYDEEDLNGYCGFNSEAEAVGTFMEFNKKYEYAFRDNYTLITLYEAVDADWN